MKNSDMKRNTLRYPFIIILILPVLHGCNRASYPPDLPELYPCEISVLSEGKPLVGAKVSFYKDDPGFKWGIGGVTNESGIATMMTHGRYPGSPEGDFIVVITKLERDKFSPQKNGAGEGRSAVRPGVVNVYTWIDPLYADMETSPLKLVFSKKTKPEFEVGKIEKRLYRSEIVD